MSVAARKHWRAAHHLSFNPSFAFVDLSFEVIENIVKMIEQTLEIAERDEMMEQKVNTYVVSIK